MSDNLKVSDTGELSLHMIGTSEQWILPFCHNVPVSGSKSNKTNIDGT